MPGWEGSAALPLRRKKNAQRGLIYWRLIAACYCHRWDKQTLSGPNGFLQRQSKAVSGQGGHVLLASISSNDFTISV